jgi:DNA-directed RNA polymerase subunit RPC12/RpoP
MEKYKCVWCKRHYSGYSNNGQPLIDGPVCGGCNHHVIVKRLSLIYENGNEFCLVVGYVGDQKACVFERNSVTFNEIQDTVQILSTQEAVKVYLSKY